MLGDFQLSDSLQAVRPSQVIDTILQIVMSVKRALNAYFVAVAFSTLAFFVLSMSLSLRLRASELALMKRIGGSRGVILSMIASEVVLIVSLSATAAYGLSIGSVWVLQSLLIH